MADRAVLCGINDYKLISDLSGCRNDVNNIERLLTETYGFNPDNIRKHPDEEVTRDAIEDGFKWLGDGAKEGDRLLFHFSGHGSFIQSEDSDEDFDELLCLWDMDWNNSNSYLLDDDLGRLTRTIPGGVHLTVILDACHSGSGTRAVTREMRAASSVSKRTRLLIIEDTAAQADESPDELVRKLDLGDRDSVRSLSRGEHRASFARFVQPPARFRAAASSFRIRRLGTKMRSEMNHQLLAGAAEDQTAADAFINGEYNGAFSYFLCETARKLGTDVAVKQLMKTTIETVKAKGYSQTPQSEGPFEDNVLFGGKQGASVTNGGWEDDTDDDDSEPWSDDDDDSNSNSNGDSNSSDDSSTSDLQAVADGLMSLGTGEAGTDPLKVLSDLLRVSDKLVDLAAKSAGFGSGEESGRDSSNECVVYVHGISKHQKGYSIPWWKAMSGYLSRTMSREEVLWSQHVNRSISRDGRSRTANWTDAFEREMAERIDAMESHLQAASDARDFKPIDRPRGSRFASDDFARYMLHGPTREKILGEFDRVVRPLLKAGKKVHIISHSWGTVVSYEGMRRLDAQAFSGQVANLFVVGSALSIRQVRSNLFRRVDDGRRPKHVGRIINIDAGGDIVGGSIGEHFTTHREFLGTEPVGCTQIPFTDIAFNPACAHSSYFKPKNRDVNRGIFARFINES